MTVRESLQDRVRHLDNARYHGGARALSAINLVVWHTTVGHSAEEAIAWDNRAQSNNPASYHVVIGRDGIAYRCNPFNVVAYACGNSAFPSPLYFPPGNPLAAWVNHRSISISFAGDIGDNSDELRHATREQIETGYWLGRLLVTGQVSSELPAIAPYFHRAHREVSPGRKFDPTPTFLVMAWWRWALDREMSYEEVWTRYQSRHGCTDVARAGEAPAGAAPPPPGPTA